MGYDLGSTGRLECLDSLTSLNLNIYVKMGIIFIFSKIIVLGIKEDSVMKQNSEKHFSWGGWEVVISPLNVLGCHCFNQCNQVNTLKVAPHDFYGRSEKAHVCFCCCWEHLLLGQVEV